MLLITDNKNNAMKKLATLISLCILTLCAIYAQTPQTQQNIYKNTIAQHQEKINEIEDKNKEIEASLKELSSHVNCLEYVVDKQKDIIAQEQSVIENVFSSTSWQLNIFGILLTIGGIALGWFISRKEKNMKNLLDTVEKKQKEITSLKQDIEATDQSMRKLNDEMQNNVDGLYKRLRRNETISLLERLVNVPEDIGNLTDLLLARDLEYEDFNMLFNAYTKLMEECADYAKISKGFKQSDQNQYLLLFFQHFCGKAIQTSILRKDLIEYFPTALRCAFKSDVRNSLSSLIEALNNNTIDGGNESILAQYIIALYCSQHKNYTEAYQLIIDNCKDSINLQSVWNMLVEQKVIIEPFGNLLCEKYKEDTEFTKKVKKQIATLLQNKK